MDEVLTEGELVNALDTNVAIADEIGAIAGDVQQDLNFMYSTAEDNECFSRVQLLERVQSMMGRLSSRLSELNALYEAAKD